MVAKRLREEDLAARLDEVLDRVRAGERFSIEREGEVIAEIVPQVEKPGLTWGEFLAKYHTYPRPDDRFADDLEAILAEREMLPERRRGDGNDDHDR